MPRRHNARGSGRCGPENSSALAPVGWIVAVVREGGSEGARLRSPRCGGRGVTACARVLFLPTMGKAPGNSSTTSNWELIMASCGVCPHVGWAAAQSTRSGLEVRATGSGTRRAVLNNCRRGADARIRFACQRRERCKDEQEIPVMTNGRSRIAARHATILKTPRLVSRRGWTAAYIERWPPCGNS